MEALIGWVRQIAFFLIFMTMFYHLVPQAKYQRYVRFFASLVLVILTVSPLLQLFQMEEQFTFNQEVFAYPQEVEEFRLRAEQLEGQRYDEILDAYRQTVEENLRLMAEQAGLYTVSCQAWISGEADTFGQVTAVSMILTYRRLQAGQAESQSAIAVDEVRVEIPAEAEGQTAQETEGPEGGKDAQAAALEEKIMELYQLSQSQVTVSLEE